jgi:hypothetical protein
MREHDPLGTPGDHAADLLARDVTLADHDALEQRGSRLAISQDARDHARERRLVRGEVEDEVARDDRLALAMEEDDLVLHRAGAEEDLLELASPLGLRGVAQDAAPLHVLSLLLQTRAGRERRPRIGPPPLADEEMMKQAGRHDCLDGSEGIDGFPRRPIQRDGRVDEESSVGETHHRHPRAGLHPEEAERPRLDPNVVAQPLEHGCLGRVQCLSRPVTVALAQGAAPPR